MFSTFWSTLLQTCLLINEINLNIWWVLNKGFRHLCSVSRTEYLWLLLASDWPSLCQTLWIMQLIYCVWASFSLFVTDPAKLTTPLPSSCSWPLPPPVAEGSPHPSPPVGLPASLRWKPCQRRLSHTESSASLSSSWQTPQKHEPSHWMWHENKALKGGVNWG